MKRRLPPWLVLLLLAGICAGAIAGVAFWRQRRMSNQAELLARLPMEGAVIVSIDFDALRSAGVLDLLAASGMTQEPEYRAFVEGTGFDYLRDLDSAAVSFHPTGTYFLLRGHFHWPLLKDYVARSRGICYNLFCRVDGSTPERKISFFPLKQELMAAAVSSDEHAASELQQPKSEPGFTAPAAAVWSFIPAARLRGTDGLPSGAQPFTSALAGAETIMLTLGTEDGGLELRADVKCRSSRDAAALASQLGDITGRLRQARAAAGRAQERDLSEMLAGGSFKHKDGRVLGRWPLDRSWLTSMAGGAL